MAALKSLVADLNRQLAALTARSEELTVTARRAVTSKNKTSALAALRSKKLADTTLSRRSQMLAQVEEIYSMVERAADQADMVRVMDASANVLRSLNSEIGPLERVEDVVEGLTAEMNKAREVEDAISGVNQGYTSLEEVEVDEELQRIEREQQLEKDQQEAARTQQRLSELSLAEDKERTLTASQESQIRTTTNNVSDVPADEQPRRVIRQREQSTEVQDARNVLEGVAS